MSRVHIASLAVVLVTAAGSLVGCPDNAQIVIFKEPALEAAVRAELGIPFGFLTRDQLKDLYSLDASGRGITDLTGLEFAINLINLNLDTNEVSDLLPLANLVNLQTINLDSNLFFDLTPLAGLLNLTTLSLFDNQVADLQPLITNALNGGLGEGDVVVLDEITLNDVALTQANQLVTVFSVNVVLVTPAGGKA